MWIPTSFMSPYWLFVFNFIALAYNFIVLVCTTSTLGHLLPVRHQLDTQYHAVFVQGPTPRRPRLRHVGMYWAIKRGFLRRFSFNESMNLSWCKIILLTESVTLETQKKPPKTKTIMKLYLFGHSAIIFDFDIVIIYTASEVFVCLKHWYISYKSNIDIWNIADCSISL